MKRRFGAIVAVIGALILGVSGCATTDTATGDSASGQAAGTGSEFDDGSLGSGSSAKSSDATASPVFQSLIWILYCGPYATSLEVMTNRHG